MADNAPDWYEEYTEEPVREIVRYLRNLGFNTECSCGGHHGREGSDKMYVQLQYITDGEIKRLDDALFNYLCELDDNRMKNVNYTIDLYLHRVDGHLYASINVAFNTSGLGIDCP